jgi:hypothetical protein
LVRRRRYLVEASRKQITVKRRHARPNLHR